MRILRVLLLVIGVIFAFNASVWAQDTLEGEGSLNDRTPSEAYDVDLTAGQLVTITTEATSGNLDTVLTLTDSRGREVASNDDVSRGNLNSQIVYTVEETGTYTIEVSRYDNSSEGDYSITVEFGAASMPTSRSDAETLTAEGQLTDRNPSETYDIDLSAGQTVTITTEATSGNLDTVLVLYDSRGREVASNDDIERGNLNSQIIYSVRDSGTYTVEVSRYDSSTEGNYTLTILFDGGAVATPVPVAAVDTEVLEGSGRLDDTVQSETYDLDLDRGAVVTITTEATSGNLDTVLFLYAPDGSEVATNDDIDLEARNLNSQIVYTVPEGGTYSIEVTRYDEDSEGDYNITVEIIAAADVEGAPVASAEQQVFNGTGTIADGNASENWDIDLEAGSIIVILAVQTSGDLDTVLSLIDPSGNEVAFNDDRGDGSYNSEIVYQVETSGSYSIVVGRYDGSTEGDYEITVTIDPNATPDFSFVNVEGNTLAQYEGTIADGSEEFKFEIELTTGQTIYAASEATSGDLDTVLSLLGPDGQVVAINDDRGDGTLNSAFAYTAEASGTFTLLVTRYEGSPSSGDFVLIVQQVDETVAAQIEDTSNQAISLSGPVQVIETDHFRIFYTLAGTDATTDEYVRAFAQTLEEMYDQQINRIGWAAPPTGPDGLYDTYLADVIGTELGALGYARPLSLIGDNPNSPLVERAAADSILVVDNDYYIPGSNANPQTLMRATTTHEFNHMVQFGYDANEDLFWLFEATAVWTETVTVGDEQDATGYIDQNNQYPELCFATAEMDGSLAYGDWTMLESLADRFGEEIVLRFWENAIEYDGLDVITQTLQEYGTDLSEAAAIWRLQNLAMDYELGSLFPRPVWLEEVIDGPGDWSFRGNGVQELGANYFEVDLDGVVTFDLNSDSDLEVWLVGISGDTANAYRLGDGGTVDLSPYQNRYAMVFERNLPNNINRCNFTDYTIQVSSGGTPTGQPTMTFSAENFQTPG